MSTKKLCLAIESLQAGGAERVMSELAVFFCRRNELEVHLIIYGKRPDIFYKLPDNIIIHKPESAFVNGLRYIYAIGRGIFLRQTIKKIKPDSILSFGEYWNSFVLLALIGLSFPVYISDRCSPNKKYGSFHSFLRKWLYPKARGIIAQTEKAKELYPLHFKNSNIRVINNPVHFIESSATPLLKENIVLTVGRLINTKNHDKLIELFCNISNPEWKLIIVGGDALKQKNMVRLKNLISSLNAESRVILTGYRHDIEMIYRSGKIFVFASLSEGFPNVIGEAMSFGLPVIAFDCIAGPSDMIIDGENGFLIPVNDYETFQSRLKQLMDDNSLIDKMGSRAVNEIKRLSIENIGLEYFDFIIPE